ncbi:hypothetical protein ACT5YR_03985 [Fructobacillus fructosus]|uniref:hypothetical protein n=1 Tax=Fructobacillus fructosus TaxID=1631 RepID=UPI004034DF08
MAEMGVLEGEIIDPTKGDDFMKREDYVTRSEFNYKMDLNQAITNEKFSSLDRKMDCSFARLDEKIDNLAKNLDLKLDSSIQKTINGQTKWLIGVVIGIAGIVLALIKYF